MKIIKESDNRYKYLSKLFSYKYSSMYKYFPGYTGPCIFIPFELVLSEYETCDGSTKVSFNKLEDYYNWVSCKSIKRILDITCRLTVQELFDLTVLHINDIDDRPKCPICGTSLDWRYGFISGYGSADPWNSHEQKCCSISCANSLVLSNLDKYPIKSRSQQKFYDSQWTPIALTKRMMNTFISLGDPTDEIFFYVTYTKSGYFKFGITKDLGDRIHIDRGDYIHPRIIKTLDRISAAYLEASIKLEFNGEEYLSPTETSKFFKIFKSKITKPIVNPF
jgi:hypothetical protein